MDKVDYIFNYLMDDIEFAEADSVANTVNSHGGLKLEIGNPHFASDICGSVKVIERDLEYYYYFLFYDAKGGKNFFDVSMLSNAHLSNALPRHKAILIFLAFARVPELNRFHLHEGFLVKEHRENDCYWLEQAANVTNLNKEIQHAICNQQPVFDKLRCSCGYEMFIIKKETRGLICPSCEQYIKIQD